MDCAGGTYCSGPGGTCVTKKKNGAACNPALPNQCAFGNCVDGVCCDTACTGACVSCALPNTIGTCSPAGLGAPDPRAMCKDLGKGACATNGLCDGAGSCQIYAPATVCSTELCPAGSASDTAPGTCATGTCTASTQSCAGHLTCDTVNVNTCLASCANDGQCVPGFYCSGGACVAQKAKGSVCGGDDECGAGFFCVEGVCCTTKTACGQCESCALPGSLGDCTQVDAGTVDPAHLCPDDGMLGCGHTGTCVGPALPGACAYQDGSTICAAATCSDPSHVTSARFCDGLQVPACFATCTDNTSCSDPNTCQPDGSGGMSCAPPPPSM
jgi:hypothetical protein